MKAIKLYKDGNLYFEGTCEIGEIEDVVIEPEEEVEPEEKIYLKDWITPPEPISIKKSIQTKLPYYVYAGQPANRYLWKEYADILDLILMSLFKTFSNTRECKFTGVYDACGRGSGHPAGSHKFSDVNGRAVDLSYWTLTGDCFTQRWNIPKEYSLNQLWKTDNIDTHFVSHFDWERLYYFAVRLKEVLPNARITVDQRIKDFLLQRVRYVYGKEEEAKVKFIHRDAPKHYNHHQHIHIDLDAYRKNINWEADISHWWRLKND